MNHRQVEALMAGIAPVIKQFVDKATGGFGGRIAALEARAPEKGEQGERGPEGLAGKDGRDGVDGKDGAPGAPGEKGEQGEKGADGRDGVDGKDADPVTREQIVEALRGDPSLIRDAVAQWLAANPPPAGKDGAPGERGPEGQPGKDGRDGVDGKDGTPGRDGQPGVPGRDGKDGAAGTDGKDGADGLGFDDLAVEHDGDRTLTLRFVRGERSREFSVDLPVVIDRGVWREGEFKRGDGVSWGGSFFIAQRDTSAKPETSPDWRLAIKRGRDGKDGKPGEKGTKGEKGERGEPGPRGYGG